MVSACAARGAARAAATAKARTEFFMAGFSSCLQTKMEFFKIHFPINQLFDGETISKRYLRDLYRYCSKKATVFL